MTDILLTLNSHSQCITTHFMMALILQRSKTLGWSSSLPMATLMLKAPKACPRADSKCTSSWNTVLRHTEWSFASFPPCIRMSGYSKWGRWDGEAGSMHQGRMLNTGKNQNFQLNLGQHEHACPLTLVSKCRSRLYSKQYPEWSFTALWHFPSHKNDRNMFLWAASSTLSNE